MNILDKKKDMQINTLKRRNDFLTRENNNLKSQIKALESQLSVYKDTDMTTVNKAFEAAKNAESEFKKLNLELSAKLKEVNSLLRQGQKIKKQGKDEYSSLSP